MSLHLQPFGLLYLHKKTLSNGTEIAYYERLRQHDRLSAQLRP